MAILPLSKHSPLSHELCLPKIRNRQLLGTLEKEPAQQFLIDTQTVHLRV